MGILVGFLFGRFVLGTSAGRAALKSLAIFAAFAIAMGVGGTLMTKAHVGASVLYGVGMLVVALILFARAKARFFTPGGIIPLILGVMFLVTAWGIFQHAPHTVAHVHAAHAAAHHAVSHATRVSTNGTAAVVLRFVVVLAMVPFLYLAGVWVVRLVKRQIAMEYLFRNYVKWESARMQHGA